MSLPRYLCADDERRQRVRAGVPAAGGYVNGIEFVEVVDSDLPSSAAALRQRLLLVRCYQPAPALEPANVLIEGGVRIVSIQVVGCGTLVALATSPAPAPFTVVEPWLQTLHAELLADPLDDPNRWLVVMTEVRGDFSPYTLRLIAEAGSQAPPERFDPVLASAQFSFKVECETDFDCKAQTPLVAREPSPRLDYLARDFRSLRRLMLDRMSATIPEWTERNPTDLGVALVEVLAYAGDRLAYMQDAVATEAYLGTARRRSSLRRHARLLDYQVQEGANARTWVQFRPTPGQLITGTPNKPAVPAKTRLLTRVPAAPVVTSAALRDLWPHRPTVFETCEPLLNLSHAHENIRFHTWGDDDCQLPKGATEAALLDDPAGSLKLCAGEVLVFEEVVDPVNRCREDADPAHRHAVRLIEVSASEADVVTGEHYVKIRWADDDALPFALSLAQVQLSNGGGTIVPASVAHGNVVLADHGETRLTEGHPEASSTGPRVLGRLTPAEPGSERYRPLLSEPELVHATPFDPTLPATRVLRPNPRDALPAIVLHDDEGHRWDPLAHLLGASRNKRGFVVEMERDRRAWLRFGDNQFGRRPDSQLHARYRVGPALEGNLGAEALTHVISDELAGAIVGVRNPLPAIGGTRPEPDERIRRHAPAAFRIQKRAVTAADWETAAKLHSQVQRAVAELRWTGSWHTVFICVDRVGAQPVNAAFITELRAFLEPYRLAGYDLEIDPPIFVPLDIALSVCVEPDAFAADVEERLLRRLSSGRLPDGRLGLFHPDRLSFGQPVYLSQVIAAIMAEPGVAWVDSSKSRRHRFQRLHEQPTNELAEGVIELRYLEIARLDNDPNAPENGRLELYMRGGL